MLENYTKYGKEIIGNVTLFPESFLKDEKKMVGLTKEFFLPVKNFV